MISSKYATLAILLQNPDLSPEILHLEPSEFLGDDNPKLAKIYQTTKELIELKIVPEPLMIAEKAKVSVALVRGLFESSDFNINNLPTYLQDIREATFRKEMKALGLQITESANEKDITKDQLLMDTEIQLNKIRDKGGIADFEKAKFGSIRKKYLQKVEEQKDLSIDDLLIRAPFTDYNNLFGGFFKGDYTIIAGDTSMGKTAIAADIINFALKNGKRVVSFFLEMSDEQMVQRQISKLTGELTMRQMREMSFYHQQDTREMFFEATDKLKKYDDDWYVFNSETNEITEIYSIVQRLNAIKPVDLVLVDYIQLCKFSKFQHNRTLEIGFASQLLAQLAKSTNAHVLATAQFSRSLQNRADFRPRLADLKESSYLEQSADNVILLYREGHYNPDSPNPNIAELNQAKGRNTGLGTIKLYWNGKTTSFHNLQAGQEKEFSIF